MQRSMSICCRVIYAAHTRDASSIRRVRCFFVAQTQVFTVHASSNYFMPWQKKPQRESTGSGAIVAMPHLPGGKAILTNAHGAGETLTRRHTGFTFTSVLSPKATWRSDLTSFRSLLFIPHRS